MSNGKKTKKSHTHAVHPVLKPSGGLNVIVCSVLPSHWCLWVGGSSRCWSWMGAANHLPVDAQQNLTVPVLANRPVLAEAFLVVKNIWDC